MRIRLAPARRSKSSWKGRSPDFFGSRVEHGERSLGGGRALGPVAFEGAPEVNITVTERVPPGIQHFLVKAQNAFARGVRRRGRKRGQSIINAGAIGIADA